MWEVTILYRWVGWTGINNCACVRGVKSIQKRTLSSSDEIFVFGFRVDILTSQCG